MIPGSATAQIHESFIKNPKQKYDKEEVKELKMELKKLLEQTGEGIEVLKGLVTDEEKSRAFVEHLWNEFVQHKKQFSELD